jgi:hypothetical protein
MDTARTNRQRNLLRSTLVTVLAGLLMVVLTGCPPPPAPPNPDGDTPLTQRLSDGWRYDVDHQSQFPYAQMIYFNFRDDVHDIIGVVGYGVFYTENPLFYDGANFYSATAMLMPDLNDHGSMRVWYREYDTIVPGGDPPHSTTFSDGPGHNEFECNAGNLIIDVLDPATPDGSNLADTYRIAGSITENGKTITWDLTYERVELPGWYLWEKWPLPNAMGIFPDSWIDYTVHMPVAKVNGTFTVDDGSPGDPTVYDLVDAKGYHDGFHGEFVPTDLEWDWIEYKQWTEEPLPAGSEPDLDLWIYLLNQPGPYFKCEEGWDPCMPGNLRAAYNGMNYDFFREEINIHRGPLVDDDEFPGATYPTWATVTGENEDHYLCVHWEAIEDDLGGGVVKHRVEKSLWEVPPPLKNNVTYEYVSNIEGALFAKDTQGDCSSCWNDGAECSDPCPSCGSVLKSFSGVGYTDYVGPPSLE